MTHEDYDQVPGWPASDAGVVHKTPLPFTKRWDARPLWKRALMQRGSLR